MTARRKAPIDSDLITHLVRQTRRATRTEARLARRDPSMLRNMRQFQGGGGPSEWLLPFSFDGGAIVPVTTGPAPIPGAYTLTRVMAAAGTASGSGDIDFDVLKNGSSADSFTLPESATEMTDTTSVSFADGDTIAVQITSGGSGAEALVILAVLEPG